MAFGTSLYWIVLTLVVSLEGAAENEFANELAAMQFTKQRYIKRFRMELDLRRWQRLRIELPVGYRLVGWNTELVPAHAQVKYQSFRAEIDAQVFPCLGEYEGCRKLMSEIEKKEGFVPEATWLAEYVGAGPKKTEYCGTIQAVRSHRSRASIQNIGVPPLHRGRGIGTALIQAALMGLDYVGVPHVRLEVTAENVGAIQLYRRLGFRTIRTLYKTVELAPTASSR